MPAKSQVKRSTARIAKAVKAGKAKARPGTASAQMARSMTAKQLGHFTNTTKASVIRIALLVALLSGCTTATIDLPDGTHVNFPRVWTTRRSTSMPRDGLTYPPTPATSRSKRRWTCCCASWGWPARAGRSSCCKPARPDYERKGPVADRTQPNRDHGGAARDPGGAGGATGSA